MKIHDQKLNQLLEKINFVNDNPILASAKIISDPIYILEKKQYLVELVIEDFFNVEFLKQFETAINKNDTFQFKFHFKCKVQKYNLNIIFNYINYIIDNHSLLKSSAFSKLNKDRFTLKNNELEVTAFSKIEESLILTHLSYYENQLQKYGFNNLKISINLQKKENDIEQIKNEKINNLVSNMNFEPKSFAPEPKLIKYNSKISLSKKSFETLNDIDQDFPNAVIHGLVFKKTIMRTKNGSYIYTFFITDNTNSIQAKSFRKEIQPDGDLEMISEGDHVWAAGDLRYDNFVKEQVLFLKKIQKHDVKVDKILDSSEKRRSEIHVHTKMSAMDSVVSVKQAFKTAIDFKHRAIGFTDHNNVQAFPEIYKHALANPELNVLYGVEFNVINKNIDLVRNKQKVNLNEAKFVIFDIETTGLSAKYDEIIEIGAVILDFKNNTEEKIDWLFKSNSKLSQFTKDLTNLSDELLSKEKHFNERIDEVISLFDDAILVAHNASFDIDFIQTKLLENKKELLKNPVIDTLALSRILVPVSKNYRLGTVAKKYQLEYNEIDAHRADYDANVLKDIFKKQLKDLSENYGIDNLFDIEKIIDDKVYNLQRGYHVSVYAKNQNGLKDLFKLVSKAHTKSFYNSPKLFWDDINDNRKNLVVNSPCVNGDVFEIARNKNDQLLKQAIEKYDYIEVQPPSVYKHLWQREELDEPRVNDVIKNIITLAGTNKVLASGDVHYISKAQKKYREVYIHSKGIGKKPHPLYDFKNRITDYPDQHYRTTDEMLKEFSFLPSEVAEKIVIDNINNFVDNFSKIKVIRDGLFTPVIEGSDEMLTNLCYENAKKVYGDKLPTIVEERLKFELDNIIKHGFGVVYWISHQLVKQSLNDGYLVGSRGSVGSSFVATLSEITEVNPLVPHYICKKCKYSEFIENSEYKSGYDLPKKTCPDCQSELIGEGHDIPFETFLGFNADKVPDIDLNFSGDYQAQAHNLTKKMFGEENCFRAGTISTVAQKTAFVYVRDYFTENNQYDIKKTEIERIAQECEGVKRTTGQHPGGILVVPKGYEIEDFTPVNFPADDTKSSWLTTHFDFHAIHDNLLKLDILGHVDPTALKMLSDITKINPKEIPTNDEKVLSLFSSLTNLNINQEDIMGEVTGAISLPEFGTPFVRRMLADTKPKSFAELVQISGLSHGTDVWTGNAQILIKEKNIKLSEVISCRDDIMINLIHNNIEPNTAFKIMESVRKGKGLTPEEKTLLQEKNIPEWYIESCQKIKYLFPKAHATAYVLMAWRIAWFKVYYPAEYYATYFSTRTSVFDIETILSGPNAIKAKYKAIKDKLNSKEYSVRNSVTAKEQDLITIYEVALEMYARNITFSNISLELSDSKNYIVVQNENKEKTIIPPFSSVDGLGDSVASKIIEERKIGSFKSITDLKNRTRINKTNLEIFNKLKITSSLDEDSQIRFNF